jgi:hypothetical protein
MPNTTSSSPKPPTKHQVALLQVLYKFRFATANLITELEGSKYRQTITKRLKLLEANKLIGKRYEPSYKLQGKPASYFLLLDGIRYLRKQDYVSPKVLKNAYYDKGAEDHIIEHHLHVFKTYNVLQTRYPKQFYFFSQSELREKAHFPTPRPDAYIKRIKPSKTKPNDYLLLCFEDGSYWTQRRRIRTLIQYAESERWENATQRPFPTLLLVCENEALKSRIQKLIQKELDMTYVELNVITTIDLDSVLDA